MDLHLYTSALQVCRPLKVTLITFIHSFIHLWQRLASKVPPDHKAIYTYTLTRMAMPSGAYVLVMYVQ